MDDLESKFDSEVKSVMASVHSDLGYEDARFFDKIENMGAVMTCLSMASKEAPSPVLLFLKEKNKLDQSPEAIMIKNIYAPLFPPEILTLCEEKLTAAGFSKPAGW